MGQAIDQGLTRIWLDHHDQRVEKWLRNCTPDAVLEALETNFYQGHVDYGRLVALGRAESIRIENIFDTYGCVDQLEKKRYWSQEHFAAYLSTRFPGPALSASIPILWRCFHYHAYYPFPQTSQRLDYHAFQRAVAMLAAEGNARVAGPESLNPADFNDEKSKASRRLWLLFRSMSVLSHRTNGLEKVGSKDEERVIEDLVDVLVVIQLSDACIIDLSREQLRPHAERLASSMHYVCSPIPRQDFLSLLKLLLSIAVNEPRRDDGFHTARLLSNIDPDSLTGSADALLAPFTKSEDCNIEWEMFEDIMITYLPNFEFHFRLIFTAFLTTQRSQKPAPISLLPPTRAQHLSLFLNAPVPELSRHFFEEHARQTAIFALQSPKLVFATSPSTFTTASLMLALAPIKTATLVLITGSSLLVSNSTANNAVTTGRPVIIGVLVPTPWDLARKREYRASPSQPLHSHRSAHMLFQLEPRLEILKPMSPYAWIMDLITIIDGDADPKTGAGGGKAGLRFGAEGGSGLSVDSGTGNASLRSIGATAGDHDGVQKEKEILQGEKDFRGALYQDISPQQPAWETKLQIEKLEIFDLGGPECEPTTVAKEEEADRKREKDAEMAARRVQFMKAQGSDLIQKPSPPLVGETELKRRIEGFGSGGAI